MGRCSQLFHPRNFLLSYHQPKKFVTFEWGWPTVYLIWRVFWALYHLIWTILTGVYAYEWTTSKANEITWFIYLTHWGYVVLTVSAIMEMVASIHIKCNRPDITAGQSDEMSVYLKAVWVMVNVSNAASFAISVLFWGLLYTPAYTLTTADVATHALNSFYVLANLMITAVPIRLYHFIHPTIFSVIYIVFTVIYHFAGGKNGLDKPYIYSVIDWSKPETAALYGALAALVLTPLCHVVVFLIYLARTAIFNACLKREEADFELEERKQRNF
ncbi:hypothetical protein SNE40_015526 [Patella caerulea]|uniref:Protein rolling stone n=1 Tax=Patella caerulea TaxID=87958 RepID=A0AAN8JHI9_PATCE